MSFTDRSLWTKMPTSPVKTRIPITSFGHLITEVKKQLFGIEAPSAAELTGWRKHFNSYTQLGRRNGRSRETHRCSNRQLCKVDM
ncbi:hypothetical protein FQA47_009135 [Oryzias melastigma]|uniref:Uncharacterized protein n=1 Tax=Oryzias melastigma TaxID=30732 RepID=A0A834FLF1_ORYME|nr:hypothetical protein FQA47_009135 [Oryzias melastigma]